MKMHYYGHSCFTITANNKTILFDPFISGNPKANDVDINAIQCDYILVSHGHADHILDCESIALRTGAKVVCSWEVHEWLNKKGIHKTHPMNTGGSWDFGDFSIKCVVAQHSSGLPDGSYGGNPMGFLVSTSGRTLYYAGDTALTMDMQLIPKWAKVDVAILPLGDNFTMGAEDAVLAAKMVETNKVIGVHFDTFGFIEIDHAKTMELFEKENISLMLPEINTHFEI